MKLFLLSKKAKEDDEAIGRALVKAMKSGGDGGECPPLEDLAAFVDNVLPAQERSAITNHLSQCDRCYEIYSMTHSMIKENKPHTWSFVPYALAASIAVVSISVYLVYRNPASPQHEIMVAERKVTELPLGQQFAVNVTPEQNAVESEKTTAAEKNSEKKGYSPPSAGGMLKMLAKGTDIKSLNELTRPPDESTSYGFSEGSKTAHYPFKVGVYLVDLKIKLMAGEREESIELIRSIVGQLRHIEGSGKLIEYFNGVIKRIEKGESLSRLADEDWDETMSASLKGDDLLFAELGGWVEAGRIAAVIKNGEFFDLKDVRYYSDRLEGKGVQPAIALLKDIENILSQEKMTDKEFSDIEGMFRNLMALMTR